MALAGSALLAACSGGDTTADPSTTRVPPSASSSMPSRLSTVPPSAPATNSDPTTTTTTASPSTTRATSVPTTSALDEPAAEARRAVEELIALYNEVVAQILADPSVASDLEHPSVVSYLELFSPDNQFPVDTLGFWAGQAGRFYRVGPRGVMYESSIVDFELREDGTAVAQVCTFASAEVVDGSGNPIEAIGGVNGGEVVAVMSDAGWRLRDLTRTSADRCPDPSGGP